jgi:hypothetical protein
VNYREHHPDQEQDPCDLTGDCGDAPETEKPRDESTMRNVRARDNIRCSSLSWSNTSGL